MANNGYLLVFRSRVWSKLPDSGPFACACPFSFYKHLGPLPPKHLGGKCYHMVTKEEARCTIKVKSTRKVKAMDAVHGRDGVTKAGKGHRPTGGGLAQRRWKRVPR